jgi:hypothetical protein
VMGEAVVGEGGVGVGGVWMRIAVWMWAAWWCEAGKGKDRSRSFREREWKEGKPERASTRPGLGRLQDASTASHHAAWATPAQRGKSRNGQRVVSLLGSTDACPCLPMLAHACIAQLSLLFEFSSVAPSRHAKLSENGTRHTTHLPLAACLDACSLFLCRPCPAQANSRVATRVPLSRHPPLPDLSLVFFPTFVLFDRILL